jgi:hypothetical protein
MSDKIILPGPVQIECDTNFVSDGYHTFGELYEHRFELFIALMLSHPEISFRARLNSDGNQYPGWFVAGMNLPNGQISYHLPEAHWMRLGSLTTFERSPGYDGHTSLDVVDRLRVFSSVHLAQI